MTRSLLLFFFAGSLSACTSFFPQTEPSPARNGDWKGLIGSWKFDKCRGSEIQPAWIEMDAIRENGVDGLRIQKWSRSEASGEQFPDQVYKVFPRTLKQAHLKANDLSDSMPIEWTATHTISDDRIVISYQWQPAAEDQRGRWLGSGIGNYFVSADGELIFKRKGITYMAEPVENRTEAAEMVNWESHCFYTRMTRPRRLLSQREASLPEAQKETRKN